MTQNKDITIFEGQEIRRLWDKKKEKWYFSLVDIIAVLTSQLEHKKAQSYWTTLKNRLKEEGSEVVTNCDQLKMEAMGLEENKTPARKGGRIAKNARLELENKTGKRIVSGENFLLAKKESKKLR